jgi:beta-1,4-mannosyl-glycoprotein beta-1,4-N-acetylglucosaminyltransferase
VIQDAGWHWSYLGGVDAVIQKIRSYSHTEANTERIADRSRIERALRDGTDFLGRWYLGYRFETTPVDDTYPAFVRDNQPALADWIRPGQSR